jgi:hypothetical protein
MTVSFANKDQLNISSTYGINYGMLTIYDNGGYVAMFRIYAGVATIEITDPDGKYSITGGNAGTTNVYNSSSSCYLENKTGGARTYVLVHTGN